VLALLVAGAAGGLAALIHAFVAVTLRANQYVSGLALAMFGLGLTGVLGRGWEGIPLEHTLPEISGLTVLGLVLAITLWVVLYHTRVGLNIRSAGESPAAVEAMGLDVAAIRYASVVFGGVLAGVAGGFLSVAYRPSWTEGMTGGTGWIAIAIAIFAGWDPLRAVWGSLLFGALFFLSFRLQTHIAPEALRMLPFAFTILVLAVTARSRRGQAAPEALGLPYAGGER
jgi:simple sugar transport system permease protein